MIGHTTVPRQIVHTSLHYYVAERAPCQGGDGEKSEVVTVREKPN
jgi:hypothetical protein